MRAYFLFMRGKTAAHNYAALATVPVDGFYATFTARFGTEPPTPHQWANGEEFWRVQSPPDMATLESIATSGIQAGAIPAREWSVEVPDNILKNPLAGRPITDSNAPIQRWMSEILMAHDGTAEMTGTALPRSMTAADHAEHVRTRLRHMGDDALGAIALRAASVGQKAAPKVAPMKGSKEYTRPNGKKYYARKWGNHVDVEVLRNARTEGMFTLLLSPPGTGKTAAIEAAFGEEMYTLVGTANTEETDLVGTYVPNPDGSFLWVDGPLIRALREGKVMYVDEVGLIESKVMSLLYPLMDGRDEITVTINPAIGTIKAAPGFFVVASTNPKAPGVRMSEALLSRFSLQAEMTTDYSMLEKVIGVNSALCRLASNLAVKQREGEVSWAPQFRELEDFARIEKKYGTDFALANMMATVPEHDRDEVRQAIAGTLGSKVEEARIV